jgi:hypothetical protein
MQSPQAIGSPVKASLNAGAVVIIDGVPYRVRKATRKDVVLRKIDPRLLKRSN